MEDRWLTYRIVQEFSVEKGADGSFTVNYGYAEGKTSGGLMCRKPIQLTPEQEREVEALFAERRARGSMD